MNYCPCPFAVAVNISVQLFMVSQFTAAAETDLSFANAIFLINSAFSSASLS
jgi:hypothetical protein